MMRRLVPPPLPLGERSSPPLQTVKVHQGPEAGRRPRSQLTVSSSLRCRHTFRRGTKIDAVLAALRVHVEHNDEARKCLDYVTRNQYRMRYPDFRAAGLCTSTGVVEAGCKLAIGTRCKRAGMHWTVAGADAIIALRCCKLSGRFEDFWERRSPAATGTLG